MQENIFSLNLVLTHVRSPYITYEALNRTMQSQTTACSTKCQQKAEHSMTEVKVQNFLFCTLTAV